MIFVVADAEDGTYGLIGMAVTPRPCWRQNVGWM